MPRAAAVRTPRPRATLNGLTSRASLTVNSKALGAAGSQAAATQTTASGGAAIWNTVHLALTPVQYRSVDERVSLVLANTTIGSENKASASNWPTTEAVANYGGVSDNWGETLLGSDVTDSDFGIVIAVTNVGSLQVASIDYIEITLTYTWEQNTITLTLSPQTVVVSLGASPITLLGSYIPAITKRNVG